MKKYIFSIFCGIYFLGCANINMNNLNKFNAPASAFIPSSKQSWMKNGTSSIETEKQSIECSKWSQKNYYDHKSRYISYQICMLKNGYIYTTKPIGFSNQCVGFMYNLPSCLSSRGEIYLNNEGRIVWRKTGKEIKVDDFRELY